MEIETICEGVHPDGIKFRVRYISGMFYYAEQLPDSYGGWVWRTVMRSPIRTTIDKRVIADRDAKIQHMEMLKERGLI